ncbi:hypothetical protein [Sphingomonas sp.]|uniref:hypothetical protein n=1 Tax=Sphingomonas sp. TaxID=28214 RepID=UPI002FDADFD4
MKLAIFLGGFALLGAASLASCGGPSAGELAEREYRVVDQPGSMSRDKCEAARKVAAAYMGQDEAKYHQWQMTADLDCLNARMGA